MSFGHSWRGFKKVTQFWGEAAIAFGKSHLLFEKAFVFFKRICFSKRAFDFFQNAYPF